MCEATTHGAADVSKRAAKQRIFTPCTRRQVVPDAYDAPRPPTGTDATSELVNLVTPETRILSKRQAF